MLLRCVVDCCCGVALWVVVACGCVVLLLFANCYCVVVFARALLLRDVVVCVGVRCAL